jgi:ATP-dependent DNA ligase
MFLVSSLGCLATFPMRPVNGGPLESALAIGSRSLSADYWAEPKFNGWRAVVHAPTGQIWNRKGDPLSIASEFKVALAALHAVARLSGNQEWFDVEGLSRRHAFARGALIVLDNPGRVSDTYHDRRKRMEDAFPIAPHAPDDFAENGLYVPPNFRGGDPEQIRFLYQQLLEAGGDFYEGLVMKKGSSLYEPLRRATGESPAWMKHRWNF